MEAMARGLALRHLGVAGAAAGEGQGSQEGGAEPSEPPEPDIPDLLEVRSAVRSQGRGTRQSIVVEEIRHLTDFLLVHSARGRGRVAVLHYADEMTPPAANALLKILEEPPPQAALLLSARPSGKFPATILSRVRVHRLQRCTLEAAVAWMGQSGGGAPACEERWLPLLWSLACGVPERFEQLAQTQGDELVAGICRDLAQLGGGDRPAGEVAEQWAKERPTERLDLCYGLFAHLLRARHGDRSQLELYPSGSHSAELEQALSAVPTLGLAQLAERLQLAISRCGSRQVGGRALAGEWIREGGPQRLDWSLREFLEALARAPARAAARA